jgi:hypothetical protein
VGAAQQLGGANPSSQSGLPRRRSYRLWRQGTGSRGLPADSPTDRETASPSPLIGFRGLLSWPAVGQPWSPFLIPLGEESGFAGLCRDPAASPPGPESCPLPAGPFHSLRATRFSGPHPTAHCGPSTHADCRVECARRGQVEHKC